MKKIIFYIASIFLILSSCTSDTMVVNENSGNRIQLIEFRNINGYRYEIVRIGSYEYMTHSNGGIIRLGL